MRFILVASRTCILKRWRANLALTFYFAVGWFVSQLAAQNPPSLVWVKMVPRLHSVLQSWDQVYLDCRRWGRVQSYRETSLLPQQNVRRNVLTLTLTPTLPVSSYEKPQILRKAETKTLRGTIFYCFEECWLVSVVNNQSIAINLWPLPDR